MSQLETYYPELTVGEIADRPFGLVFLDWVCGRIEEGDPDDMAHQMEIIDVLDAYGPELVQQRRKHPIIQDEVDPKAVDLPRWIWVMSNISD